MTVLAPVGISVYTRIGHFRRSVGALQQNALAQYTNLVIYSDAPSKVEDEAAVHEVRKFAHNISGFKTVTVIERPVNFGGVRNAHEGLKQLIRVFKVAIYVEDDIEVAPGFLTFMNQALQFYKDNSSVISISGYSPPLQISGVVKKDYYTMNRFCGWGCGVYERTMEWLATKITKQEFDNVEDKQSICEFGDDVLSMVQREVNSDLDAADVRCMFRQVVHGKATVYPKLSLVQNHCHDGSGFHCGRSNRFWHEELWGKTSDFAFDNDTKCIPEIVKEKRDFRSFKGNYRHLQTIYNQSQSREVSSALISMHFDDAFKKLIESKSERKVNRANTIAILSTPRVGSTWVCDILSGEFGDCISNEWLHRRFVEKYLETFRNSTALDYLKTLKYHAFPKESILVLHIHVNQHRYWQEKFGIDLLEFFEFSYVYYMKRRNAFSQIFSYAVANETGLWGDNLVVKANISDGFRLSIGKDKFERAQRALKSEFDHFKEVLESRVDTQFDYEEIVSEPNTSISALFAGLVSERDFSFKKNAPGTKIMKNFIDKAAKEELETWYKAVSMV